MNRLNEKKIRIWSLLLSFCGLVVVAGGWALAERGAPTEPAAAQESAAAEGPAPEIVAEVGGVELSEAELEETVADQLQELDRQRHDILQQGLDRLISDKLVELEAASRDMTREELLEAEVESQVGEVSEAEIDAFYEARKSQINRPKEAVTEQIRNYLAGQRRQGAYQELVGGLEEKYEVTKYLEPLRVAVEASGFPAKGPEDAPVTIVEFSDFECPYCSRVLPALEKVAENYPESVRIVFRQFPLSIHPNAWKAAEASLCAHDQGEFWAMHDVMFANQRQLAVEQLRGLAAEIGLDAEEFAACLESDRYSDQVQADFEAGQAAGVSGTPAMFVNGRFISGAVPYETLADVIDEELARAGRGEGGQESSR